MSQGDMEIMFINLYAILGFDNLEIAVIQSKNEFKYFKHIFVEDRALNDCI